MNETSPTWIHLHFRCKKPNDPTAEVDLLKIDCSDAEKPLLSNLASLPELGEQPVVGSQGEVERVGRVVVRVRLEVLDDVSQEVSPLHAASWRLIAQHGEVDVEVVVGGLVVQVDPQLTGRDFILLHDGFLGGDKAGDTPLCLVKAVATRWAVSSSPFLCGRRSSAVGGVLTGALSDS